jgi:hypothetical protein
MATEETLPSNALAQVVGTPSAPSTTTLDGAMQPIADNTSTPRGVYQ